MNRRDFWLLRATPHARVFELPCERLYMQYVDARRPQAGPGTTPQDDLPGEPDAQHDRASLAELFDGLARELETVDVVRIVDREWLADDDLKGEVERLVTAFLRRGGRVERD